MRRRRATRPQQVAATLTVLVGLVGTPIACWSVMSGNNGEGGVRDEGAPTGRSRAVTPPVERFSRVEGWVPYWGDPVGTARKAARAGYTDLLFFGATLKSDGTMKMEQTSRMTKAVSAAHAGGVESWLTVANHGKSLAKVLTPSNRERLIDKLLAAHRVSGCRHLDLDLEQLTKSQTAELPPLARALSARMPSGARLGITLQPVDSRLRPWAIPLVEALLDDPGVFTVRFMCYDYHWRTSLPGALYPQAAFERLLHAYPGRTGKLTAALPLYGYDWPRPEDVTVPAAGVITISELAGRARRPGARLVWMAEEGELALFSGTAGNRRMAAVPSLRTIRERCILARQHGVPAVAFWHLGCGHLGPVRDAVEPEGALDDPPAESMDRWADALTPWKERVCQTVTATRGDSFASLAKRHRVTRSALYRFNEGVTDESLPGTRIYLPLKR